MASSDRTTTLVATIGSTGSPARAAAAADATATERRRGVPPVPHRDRLLAAGVSLASGNGWDSFGLADVARRAGVGLRSVHRHFPDVETLALAVAHRFEGDVYGAAVAAVALYPEDLRTAMRHCLERFFEPLREERVAYVALVTGAWRPPRLKGPLHEIRVRKRRRLVDIWARYYERVSGLCHADACRLSSFQYDGLRGLVRQVDNDMLASEGAIGVFLEVLTSGVARLGGEVDTRSRNRSSVG